MDRIKIGKDRNIPVGHKRPSIAIPTFSKDCQRKKNGQKIDKYLCYMGFIQIDGESMYKSFKEFRSGIRCNMAKIETSPWALWVLPTHSLNFRVVFLEKQTKNLKIFSL